MAVSNFVPQVWHATIMENFRTSAVISNTVAREYEGTAEKGNIVHINEFAAPDIVDYSLGNGEGARTITPQELSATNQALAIDQEKAFAFFVDDIDRAQAAGSFDPITRDASAGLVEDSETFLAETVVANGTVVTPDTAVSDGNTAYDLILQMRTELSSSTVKAPLAGRTLLVNPEFSRYLLGADSKLTNVDMSGDEVALRSATLGQLLGFQVVESPLLSPGTPAAAAYHRSAIGYVNQLDNVEALRDTRKFADIVRGLMVYGGRVLRPEATLVYTEPVA